VSTQAGCALACTFCATGRLGLERNLEPAEITAQVLHAAALVAPAERAAGQRAITNIVFMGMGEPFANYDRMRGAIGWLTDPAGFGLGDRHITVSTAGLVPGIDRFAAEGWQVGLAISLHAPNDALRSELMPIDRRYPIAELLAACRRYTTATRRRLTFEYVLIDGVNDSDALARELAVLLRGMLCHVNLIPMNPIGEGSPLARSQRERVRAFRDLVAAGGIACTVRQERGVEIYGACGQLHRYTPTPRSEHQPVTSTS
jgi:23S rRNA (adenine2503-C2)-methyltransferase